MCDIASSIHSLTLIRVCLPVNSADWVVDISTLFWVSWWLAWRRLDRTLAAHRCEENTCQHKVEHQKSDEVKFACHRTLTLTRKSRHKDLRNKRDGENTTVIVSCKEKLTVSLTDRLMLDGSDAERTCSINKRSALVG